MNPQSKTASLEATVSYPDHYVSISPTGVDTHRLCPRKRAWHAVCGLESPGTAATLFGQAVHKMLEDYVRDRKPFDFLYHPQVAEAAESLRQLLALEVPHYLTGTPERKFTRLMRDGTGGWYLNGTIDLTVPPLAGATGWGGWTLVDYKTTSSIAKWSKTSEVLRWDAQAALYGYEFFAGKPYQESVRLLWLYVERGTRKTKPVSIIMTRREVAESIMRLRLDIDEMRSIVGAAPIPRVESTKTVAYVKSLPYNSAGCTAYGGCEYVGRCGLTAFDMFGRAPIAASKLVRR